MGRNFVKIWKIKEGNLRGQRDCTEGILIKYGLVL